MVFLRAICLLDLSSPARHHSAYFVTGSWIVLAVMVCVGVHPFEVVR